MITNNEHEILMSVAAELGFSLSVHKYTSVQMRKMFSALAQDLGNAYDALQLLAKLAKWTETQEKCACTVFCGQTPCAIYSFAKREKQD